MSGEMLKDYIKIESDSSENDPNHQDNLINSEESTDAISTSTCSENTSSPSNWRVTNTYAAKTLPEGLSLRCSNLPNSFLGVFAAREIKKDTIFGPYVGVRVFDEQFIDASGRMWKVFMNNRLHHYIDGQNPEKCNWMRYVNCGGGVKHQNLESFQFQYKIYYRAIVDIQEDTELLVWFSEDYDQDCHEAGDKLKNLILNKTSLTCFGNECQDLELAASNTSAVTTVGQNCESSSASVEEIQKDKTINGATKAEKSYKCYICGKLFKYKCSLKFHTRMHTGEKPYKCDMCNAAFVRSALLQRHAYAHSGERPYKCALCDAAFAHKISLTLHARTHTGEKPFKCDVCNATFAQSSHLKQHARTHTGEKPYKCGVCNTSFAQSSHLNEHKRTHTGNKPFKCYVCDAVFARSSQLSRHSSIHAGEAVNV